MATSKQTYVHTHNFRKCSHASVGLTPINQNHTPIDCPLPRTLVVLLSHLLKHLKCPVNLLELTGISFNHESQF